METIKIRGLVRFCGWVFVAWGGLVVLKGFYDLTVGEPESNLYAPTAWAFVSRAQWKRYAAFEVVYGAACAALSWYLFRYSRFVPETLRRERESSEFDPFR
ncbi:MAG: hypothetical protein HY551_01065 [Elusimicrobia bacterium]|nr:hypothetical protein [Elusimicrobiota bacterium]